MKKNKLFAIGLAFIASSFVSCSSNNDYNNHGNTNSSYSANSQQSQPTTNVTINAGNNPGNGLDLQALGEMLKTTKDAPTLEKMINQPGSINNLDLDGDGKTDYIKVTEYGSGSNRGLSFTVDMAGGQTQEVATVEISQTGPSVGTMNIIGNQNVYGAGYQYQSDIVMTDWILFGYLFAPHPYYVSPYYYGYYPGYYRPFGVCSYGVYGSRISSYTRVSTIRRTSYSRSYSSRISSPNSSRNASSVVQNRTNLNNSSSSQRSFSARNQSKAIGSGGFGSKSSSSPSVNTSSSRPSSSYSSPSRSSSSFGSSRSSFGGGHSSFGGSRSSGGGRRR